MHRHTAPLPRTLPDLPTLGAVGERLAVDHLTGRHRLDVVATNWRLAAGELRGELDVVALDHHRRLVVVTEVKARTSRSHGGPLVAVTPRKQAKVRALTVAFLREAQLPYRGVRLDVIGLLLSSTVAERRLEHVEGAF